MLGIMSLSIAFLLLGCYNAFLRPSYQKQPVTQEQLENLCKKLENGTYDAYQCFNEGTSLNLPKDELDPVHFTTKVVTLKKGFPKVTGLYAMLDISIWELESEGDAIKKYEAFLTNYWTNPFESKEESRQEIMEKGYLEIENQRYRAFIGPIEFSANFFEPTKGDSVRRLYRVTVQYGPMLVQISERTEMGGVKLILPDLIIQDRMFDPDFKHGRIDDWHTVSSQRCRLRSTDGFASVGREPAKQIIERQHRQ